jgi:hypothetical protein
MVQELVNVTTPKTCKECFNTQFKLPRPQCHYEKAYHLKKSLDFFKKEFGMDIGIDVNLFIADIKPLCKQCLSTVDKRADRIRQDELIRGLADAVISIKEDIEVLKNNNHKEENKISTPIYKQQKEIETPVRPVMRAPMPEKAAPELKIKLNKKEPIGGWKFAQRNIKKKNIPIYLEEFKKEYPEYSEEINKVIDGRQSDFVELDMNKSGNFMIKYRDFKK